MPTVTANISAPMSANELWDSLMTVDDFVELLARTPKEPYPTEYVESIDIRADAFKWGFCAKYPYSLGQLDDV